MWRWIAIYHSMTTSPLSEYVTTTQERYVISAHSWTGRQQTLSHVQLFTRSSESLQIRSLQSNRIEHLQWVQNTLACIVCTALYRVPTSGLRKSLHWLPIRQQIIYKIVTFTFKVWVHGLPVDLANLIIDHTPSGTLNFSGKDFLIVPGSRRNSPPGNSVWNNLPIHIRSIHYRKPLMETTKTTSVWHCI